MPAAPNNALVELVIEKTKASAIYAKCLLFLCKNDADAAVAMFFKEDDKKFPIALNVAKSIKRWLLVSVQDRSQDSQVLNRDVWSNQEVRALIRPIFLFWQFDPESREGRIFSAFYEYTAVPYVCIIDPHTGEEIWSRSSPKSSTFIKDLKEFIIAHNSEGASDLNSDEAEDDSEGEGEDKPAVTSIQQQTAVEKSNEHEGELPTTSKGIAKKRRLDENPESKKEIVPKKRVKIWELTEEEQVALAINKSINVSAQNSDEDEDENEDEENGSSECDSSETSSSYNESVSEGSSIEKDLDAEKNNMTLIILRFPKTSLPGEIVVQLYWPLNTYLRDLRHCIEKWDLDIVQQGYRLICSSQQILNREDDHRTLKELGLYPIVTIDVCVNDSNC